MTAFLGWTGAAQQLYQKVHLSSIAVANKSLGNTVLLSNRRWYFMVFLSQEVAEILS